MISPFAKTEIPTDSFKTEGGNELAQSRFILVRQTVMAFSAASTQMAVKPVNLDKHNRLDKLP